MNLIPQLILAARSKGVEEWMNILFVVVVAIFWAVGGILKAKANKAKQEPQQGTKPGTKPHPATAKGIQQLRHSVGPAQAREHHPSVQPPRREVRRPQLSSKTLEDKYVGIPAQTSQGRYVSELLSDYADPDKLKRAILHYEILGKPLSLRETSELI